MHHSRKMQGRCWFIKNHKWKGSVRNATIVKKKYCVTITNHFHPTGNFWDLKQLYTTIGVEWIKSPLPILTVFLSFFFIIYHEISVTVGKHSQNSAKQRKFLKRPLKITARISVKFARFRRVQRKRLVFLSKNNSELFLCDHKKKSDFRWISRLRWVKVSQPLSSVCPPFVVFSKIHKNNLWNSTVIDQPLHPSLNTQHLTYLNFEQ